MTVRYKSATLDEFIEHHSHDVSCGGMFIKTPQPFTRGTLLKFEVRIAGDKKVMQGVGRVVWKRELAVADTEHPAGMGVSFIKLDEESRRLIDQLVHSRDGEASAFDAERAGAGVDAESTVGLGTDPIPTAGSKAPSSGPSFFPKGEPAEQPPPEDRTVMKQAAELLEEALREVDAEPAAVKPQVAPLASAGDAEEKEDTKPGRPSKSGESVPIIPVQKSPSAEKPAAGLGALSAKPQTIISANPVAPLEMDMASMAEEITAKARQATESAKPKRPAPPPNVSGRPAPLGPVASVAPGQSKEPARQPPRPSPAVPVPTETSSTGAGRAVFWLLAVAVCAGGTWWLWKPRSSEPPASEPTAASEPAAPATPEPSAVEAPGIEPQPAAVATAPSGAVSQGVSSAAPPPNSAAPAVPRTVSTQVVAPQPAIAPASVPAAVPRSANTQPKTASGVQPSEHSPSTPVESEPKPAVVPERTTAPTAKEKPAEPATATPKTNTAEAPAAPAKQKRAVPAADSDNPY